MVVRMKPILAVLIVLTFLVGAVGASAQTPIRQHIKHPPKQIRHKRHFTPESQPTPDEVHEIAALEQKRWGGPSIIGRISCETGGQFNWNATNGQYRGLLQIGSIWGYLYDGAPRDVKLKESHHVKRPVYRIRVYEGGRKTREFLHMTKVEIVQVKKGHLPDSADPYNGWAAIRVGQLAIAGDRTTAWECPV